MPVVSAGDLTSLRSEYQRTAVRFSWLVPPVLWSARINDGSIVKGETTIAFDTGTGSYFSMVGELQEVWVGTAAGDNDVGRLRIKSISSGDAGVTGSVTVGGHSHPLQDDLHLTFLHDYPLKPKYSYIDPSTEAWYMDDTVTYSDQHTKPPPVVIAGPHRAGFLISGTATFNVDASDSYTIASGATKSSYALSVASTAGTPTVNFNTGTGLGDITFTAAGVYWAKYSVTDSNGKTQDSYRCYILHVPDDPTNADAPWIDCEGVQLEADWENGGWTAGVKAHDNMTLDDIPDHALCIIWHSPWYEGAIKHVTFLPDDNPAVFIGYVREDAGTQQMAEGFGEVDLTLSTIEGRLRQMFTFSTSLIVKKTAPTEWWEYEKWQTCGTIVHDLFLWRSTLLEIADVIGLRDDTLNRMFQGFDEGNIYDNANNFLYSEGIRKKVLSDQGGRLHVVEDQQLMVDADRGALTTSFPLIQTAAIADYGAAFAIQRMQEFTAPFVTANGIYWDGNTWDDEDRPESNGEYCSIAPGGKPLYEGPDPQDFPKQTVSSQDHLNQICGRYEAKVNNPVTEVVVEFHGMYNTVLDIAYGEQHTISLQTTETPRGVVWANKPLYTKHIQAIYEAGIGVWAVNAAFEPENITTDGVYTECPSFPPLGGEVPPISTIGEPGALLTGASVNFKGASTDLWVQHLSQDVKDLIEDPYWRTKTSSTSPDDAIAIRCGVGYIKRTTDAFESVDVDITPSNDPPNDAGDSPAPTATGVTYTTMEGSYPDQDEFAVIARWQNASSEWRSWIAFTDDNGTTWSWKYLGTSSTCSNSGTKSSSFTSTYSIVDLRYSVEDLIVEVSTNKYVTLYVRGGHTYVRAFSVNTTTEAITFGNEVDIGAISSGITLPGGGKLTKVDTDKFAVVSYYSQYVPVLGYDVYAPQVKIGTLSGETISLGSANKILNDYEAIWIVPESTIYWNPQVAVCCPNSSTIIAFWVSAWVMRTDGDDCVLETLAYRRALWGTISGSLITWDNLAGDCGDVDKEVVGDWYTVDDTDLGSYYVYEAWTFKKVGSVGLAAWSAGGGDTLKVAAMTSASNSKSAPVVVDQDGVNYYVTLGLGGWNLEPITSTKALIVWQVWRYQLGVEDYYEVYAATVTVNGAAAPVVGSHQLLFDLSDIGQQIWMEDIKLTALSSTEVAMSYHLEGEYENQCNGIAMLDISGDTVTVDENCYDGMHEGLLVIQAETSSKFMILGRGDPGVDNAGYVWAGVTANDLVICSGSLDSYAIGLALGKSVGNKVWVTHASGTGSLELLEIALPGLTITERFDLGAATIAEVIAKTRTASPFVPFGYDDAVYVFGNMDDPYSLGDPVHAMRTTDGATSFGVIENGWGVDYCGALIVTTGNYMYAIRCRGAEPKLYRDEADNNLLLRLTLPFSADVVHHGVLVDYRTADVYVCANAADPIMVVKIPPPWLIARDITYDHEAIEGIWSIVGL